MTESEVWADIGYVTPDKRDSLPAKLAHHIEHTKKEVHESEDETAKRRAKSLGSIFSAIPDAEIKEDGSVVGTALGRQIIFWPASDCWFSYTKGKYDTGIEKLCSQIEKVKKDDQSRKNPKED